MEHPSRQLWLLQASHSAAAAAALATSAQATLGPQALASRTMKALLLSSKGCP
jgi:hypothetical protein